MRALQHDACEIRHEAHGRWVLPIRSILLRLVLVLAIVTAFGEATTFAFVNWDDEPLLLHNAAYRGFGLDQLRWMFTTTLGGHYQPLTWLSFAVDHAVWSLSPGGFHFSNILLHLLCAIIFLQLVRRLLSVGSSMQDTPTVELAAAIAAFCFAIHPLRVESVAWVTERRDVLSGVFFFGTLALYLRYATDPRRPGCVFAGAITCFLISLLAKASGMVVPVVLLVLDVYPLRRVALTRVFLFEKVAFAVPAFAAAVVALRAQQESGALWTFADHPLPLRIGQACYGVLFYVWKTVLPFDLSPLYEQPPSAQPLEAEHVVGAIFFVAVSIGVWTVRKRAPALSAAWICYLLLLAPVLGFAQSGPHLVADRYSYLSCIPWAILIAGAFLRWYRISDRRPTRMALLGTAAIVLTLLGMLTRQQARVWRNSETLWSSVLDRAPRTGLAHANLAAVLNQQGRYEPAKVHADEALTILPGNRTAHASLATASLALGDWVTAEAHFRRVIEIDKHLGRKDPASVEGLAQALVNSDRPNDAVDLYRSFTESAPQDAHWPLAIGTLLTQQGRLDEARDWLERAVRIAPDLAAASLRLGVVHRRLGDTAQAIEVWEAGLRRVPEDRDMLSQLAWTLATSANESLRDPNRAKQIASILLNRSDGNDLARAKEILAAAVAADGDFVNASRMIRELLAQPIDAAGSEARQRWQRQLAKYESGEAMRE